MPATRANPLGNRTLGSRIRLVALDLDGTLLNSRHEVSAATTRALQTLRRHGVSIALVTGRRFRNVARIVQEHGLGDITIVHNGAVIRRQNGDLLFFEELDPSVCHDIIDASSRLDQFPLLLVDPLQTRVFFQAAAYRNNARSEYLTRNQNDAVEVQSLHDALTGAPVIQMLFTHAIAPLQECKRQLIEQFAKRATILETSYPDRDHVFVDVIHRNCSKGRALAWLMRRENLSPGEVMAFGDNHNDLEMLQIAGHAFLMDNADDDLKRLGFHIAPANDQDGVAQIVGEYWP